MRLQTSVIAVFALLCASTVTQAEEGSRYSAWEGFWGRGSPPGSWDPTKPPGRTYFTDPDGYLMPIQKDEPPPDPQLFQKYFGPKK